MKTKKYAITLTKKISLELAARIVRNFISHAGYNILKEETRKITEEVFCLKNSKNTYFEIVLHSNIFELIIDYNRVNGNVHVISLVVGDIYFIASTRKIEKILQQNFLKFIKVSGCVPETMKQTFQAYMLE
ncbi:MAG: hypothetical protein WC606_01435 [Candidatus Absconditabacterales bacterium]|jgi:hypothetical protein